MPAWIDVVFLIIIAFLTIRGALRGFVKELLSMAGIILGVVAGLLFSGVVAEFLADRFGGGDWLQIVAFLGLFVIVYIIVKIFENALNNLVERIHAQSLDHALGLFLGVIEGVLACFVVILLLQLQPFFAIEPILEESIGAAILLPFLPFVEGMIGEDLFGRTLQQLPLPSAPNQ